MAVQVQEACESCGAPRGAPHADTCQADVAEHYGEAVATLEVED